VVERAVLEHQHNEMLNSLVCFTTLH